MRNCCHARASADDGISAQTETRPGGAGFWAAVGHLQKQNSVSRRVVEHLTRDVGPGSIEKSAFFGVIQPSYHRHRPVFCGF
jgi:hypothetical protein